MTHDIFISYRRDGGEHLAGRVKDALKGRGFSVFMDVEDLKSGKFDAALFKKIEEAADVIVILTPGSLERCKNADDWLRQEIRHAIECQRNVVPILARGFQMPPAASLPADIADLAGYNGVVPTHELFDASMDRLISTFLMSRPRARDPGGERNSSASAAAQDDPAQAEREEFSLLLPIHLAKLAAADSKVLDMGAIKCCEVLRIPTAAFLREAENGYFHKGSTELLRDNSERCRQLFRLGTSLVQAASVINLRDTLPAQGTNWKQLVGVAAGMAEPLCKQLFSAEQAQQLQTAFSHEDPRMCLRAIQDWTLGACRLLSASKRA